MIYGVPDWIHLNSGSGGVRTPDLWIKSPSLYLAKLRTRGRLYVLLIYNFPITNSKVDGLEVHHLNYFTLTHGFPDSKTEICPDKYIPCMDKLSTATEVDYNCTSPTFIKPNFSIFIVSFESRSMARSQMLLC